MKQDYVVKADGPIAGKRRKAGEVVQMTAAAAKYENVARKSEVDAQAVAKVELAGSPDDPTVKSTGLADKAKAATTKRSRAKK